MMIKGKVCQGDITILNPSNERASKYRTFKKLIELQREIDKPTVIIGYFNTLLSGINRRNKHQISKDPYREKI